MRNNPPMRPRRLICLLLAAGIVLFAACEAGFQSRLRGGDTAWTAAPVGSPATTAIDLTFDAVPAGLTVTDITITSGTGSATRGSLTGSGTTRRLALSNVSAGTVTVSINRDGIASRVRTVTLLGPITWTATPVGSPVTTTIDFTFGAAPTGLAAADITIASGTGSATRGSLTGSGTTRRLALSNVSAGTVSVSINRAGVASGPQTVTLLGPALTGTISITGNAAVGHMLTANVANLGGSGTVSFQWRRGTTDIGTNSST
ncbi:MAG: hypothetical protein FWD88_08110, partial [Treponema sp.]|nr:hypothetical protein [Treponema sp.]